MNLVPVSSHPMACQILYDLLKERPKYANISHKAMPTWAEHCAFVASNPYEFWGLIEIDGQFVGSIYLTHQREVGIFIFRAHANKGYAEEAVRLLMQKYPGPVLANVAPENAPSHAMFQRMGGRLIQWTYEIGVST